MNTYVILTSYSETPYFHYEADTIVGIYLLMYLEPVIANYAYFRGHTTGYERSDSIHTVFINASISHEM